MAELIKLNVQERAEQGKGANRELRRQGLVPGVFYDQKGENISVKVKEVPLYKVWKEVRGSQVFELVIEKDGGDLTLPALIWDVQYHPVKGNQIHVDFFGVDVEKAIKVKVPLVVEGKSEGEKVGGRLELYRDTLEVLAKPLEIPKYVAVNVDGMQIGEGLRVEDLEMPEGVSAIYDNNFAVVHVIAKGAEVEEEAEGEGAEGGGEEAEATEEG